ncbi:hypothetical protein V8F33_002807 [Rhypophila sp. PSN 637]
MWKHPDRPCPTLNLLVAVVLPSNHAMPFPLFRFSTTHTVRQSWQDTSLISTIHVIFLFLLASATKTPDLRVPYRSGVLMCCRVCQILCFYDWSSRSDY